MNSNAKETEIINAARQGDLNAFNILILEHQDLLFRIAVRLMRDEMPAADMLQDACLLAFQKLASFRDGSFRNWFARIVVNRCYDELRRQRRHPVHLMESDDRNDDLPSNPYWLADFSANPEVQLEVKESNDRITDCLQQLPPRQRTVLTLVDIEDYSYEEAAEILDIPVGTIKSRLARARMQMRGLLDLRSGLQSSYHQYERRGSAQPVVSSV